MREFNKQSVFLKDNTTKNTKTIRDRIITPIPFVSFSITKEITKSRSRLKFVVLMRLKKNETCKTKQAELKKQRW